MRAIIIHTWRGHGQLLVYASRILTWAYKALNVMRAMVPMPSPPLPPSTIFGETWSAPGFYLHDLDTNLLGPELDANYDTHASASASSLKYLRSIS